MPVEVDKSGRAPVIGDLVAMEQRLEIWCGRCHRHAYMAPQEAVRLLGARTTFPQARLMLKCACGARGRHPNRWITCRGSMEDYYALLERRGGRPMPGRARAT